MSKATTVFPKYDGAKLHIPWEIWRKIVRLTDKVNTEWLGYLLRDIDEFMDTEDPFIVDDIYVPPQAVSAGSVDLEHDDFQDLNEHCAQTNMFSIGNIHSHVNMGVGPSHTDLHDNIGKQLQQPGMVWNDNGFMVTLIVNKSSDLSARIDVLVPTKTRIFQDPAAAFEMDVQILYPDEPESVSDWVTEQQQKLRNSYGGFRGRSGGSVADARRNFRGTRERGLYPVYYEVEDNDAGTRVEACNKYWPTLRRLLAAGYTIALDTRKGNGLQAVVITKKVGVAQHGERVPLILGKEEKASRERQASNKKSVLIPLLAAGDAVCIGTGTSVKNKDGVVYKYSKDNPGYADYNDVVRLTLRSNNGKALGDMGGIMLEGNEEWEAKVEDVMLSYEEDEDETLYEQMYGLGAM